MGLLCGPCRIRIMSEPVIDCQFCGSETRLCETMPDPRTGRGDLCCECYIKADDAFKVEKCAARCLSLLDGYSALYGTGLQLYGNCHYASRTLVAALNKVLPEEAGAVVRRGFWLPRYGQHSWVEVRFDDDHAIIDPTKFQFTFGETPDFAVTDTEDERYDLCGFESTAACSTGVSSGKRRFDAYAKQHLKALKNPAEISQFVKQSRSRFDDHRAFMEQAVSAGHSAMIPREWRIYYGFEPDPDADVNTRGIWA